jgi:hypothetical protein
MNRFDRLTLATVLAASAAIAGCGRNDDWQASNGAARVCVDAQGRRVTDEECGRPRTGGGVSPFLWYYLGTLNHQNAPAFGQTAYGGSFIPTNGVTYRSATPTGVVRSGFGETAARIGSFGRGFGGGGE